MTPCPECRGSGRLVMMAPGWKRLPPEQQLRGHVGFYQVGCPTCHGLGQQYPEPNPTSLDPATWVHRVPKAIRHEQQR